MALTHNSSEQLLDASRQEGKAKKGLTELSEKVYIQVHHFVCVCEGGNGVFLVFFATISVLASSLLKNFRVMSGSSRRCSDTS